MGRYPQLVGSELNVAAVSVRAEEITAAGTFADFGADAVAEPFELAIDVNAEPPEPEIQGDFNNNKKVDLFDFFLFADAFGGTDPLYDLDGNGTVQLPDFFLFADAFGTTGD